MAQGSGRSNVIYQGRYTPRRHLPDLQFYRRKLVLFHRLVALNDTVKQSNMLGYEDAKARSLFLIIGIQVIQDEYVA